MAMSIVADDAGGEPDHVFDSQIICEELFVVGSRHFRITLLNCAEQTFLSSQQSALAVDVDGAAFEDDGMVPKDRLNCRGVRGLRDQTSDFFVMTIIGVFGPGVKAPGDGLSFMPLFKLAG